MPPEREIRALPGAGSSWMYRPGRRMLHPGRGRVPRPALCSILAPRYFLKTADETDKLGQQLASCKLVENRHHPTSAPDAYISVMRPMSFSISAHIDMRSTMRTSSVWCRLLTCDHWRLIRKSWHTIKDPYANLQEHRPSEYPHCRQ